MWSGNAWGERVDVSDWCEDLPEQAGSSKGGVRWLVEPGRPDDLWLHKDVPVHQNGSVRSTDWAELIASRVGESLGVPCARTRLCWRAGKRGSLSYNVRLSDYDFVAGGPPESFAGDGSWSGFDVFVGFLILDAIIANQDRHEDNWAVLRAQLSTGRDLLAASYDHGSSLGHNLLDSKREAMLRNREELSVFACRGKAKRFEHSESRGPVTLVKLAAEAMELVGPAVASRWRARRRHPAVHAPANGGRRSCASSVPVQWYPAHSRIPGHPARAHDPGDARGAGSGTGWAAGRVKAAPGTRTGQPRGCELGTGDGSRRSAWLGTPPAGPQYG